MSNISGLTAFDQAVQQSHGRGQHLRELGNKGDNAFNSAAVQYLANVLENRMIEQIKKKAPHKAVTL